MNIKRICDIAENIAILIQNVHVKQHSIKMNATIDMKLELNTPAKINTSINIKFEKNETIS